MGDFGCAFDDKKGLYLWAMVGLELRVGNVGSYRQFLVRLPWVLRRGHGLSSVFGVVVGTSSCRFVISEVVLRVSWDFVAHHSVLGSAIGL